MKCPNCGATLEITPDALAYVCKYCGWMGTTEDISTKDWLMAEPTSQQNAQQALTDFLKKNLKHVYTQSALLEFKGQAVPIWVSKVHAHTRYNGYRQETRTESYSVGVPDGRGGRRSEMRTRSYPVYVPVRGEFNEVLSYPVLGRRHAVFFGLEELKKRALISEVKPLDVKKMLGQKIDCLDVDLEESEARATAENLAEDEHRDRVESMTTKIFDCYTDDEVQSCRLVFYSLYTAKYSYRGKSFRVTLDGVSGTVVKAELPMTLGLRVGYTILGYVGIGLAAVASLLLGNTDQPLVAFVPILGGAALAAWSTLKATSEQRVKRG